MKKKITVLAGCSMLWGTSTAFRVEPLPQRGLDYGKITEIHEENGETVSIWAEGVDLYVSSVAWKGMIGMTVPLELGATPFLNENGTMYVPAEAFWALVGYEVTAGEGIVVISQTA